MICQHCGLQLGESFRGMQMHIKRYHSDAPKPKHRPKAEVVMEWEAGHPEFFVGLGAECFEDCKCSTCFQKALDLLVAKTEAAANDAGNDFSQHNELANNELPECAGTNGRYTIQHGYGG